MSTLKGRNRLKDYFETGKRPTEAQFAELIDSFIHQSEDRINVQKETNNVGIGKQPSNAKLDVNGDINAKGFFINGEDVSQFGKWEEGTNPSDVYYTNGNVGIGVSNPTNPLHIQAEKESILKVETTKNHYSARLHVVSPGTDGYIGAYNSDYGDPQLNGKVVLNSWNQPVSLQTMNAGLEFWTGGREQLTINRNGHIGVNNPHPRETLDVNGGVKLGFSNNHDPGTLRWNGHDFEGFTNEGWRSFTFYESSDWKRAELDRGIYTDEKHTGIGAKRPAARLTVELEKGKGPEYHLSQIGSYNLLLKSNKTTAGSMVGVAFHPGTDNEPITNVLSAITGKRINNYSGELGFVTQSGTNKSEISQKMVIRPEGQVGIGVDTPKEKLEVNGALSIGATQNNAAQGTMRWTGTDFEGKIGNQWVSFTAKDLWTKDSNNRIHYTDGNVGMGLTNPSEQLEVNGAIKIGSSAFNQPGTIRWTGSDFEGRTASGWKSFTESEEGSTPWKKYEDDLMYYDGRVVVGGGFARSSLHVQNGGLIVEGEGFATEKRGGGGRMMWIPEKTAFRAGYVTGNRWDPENVGFTSFAAGHNSHAAGMYAVALGSGSVALEQSSMVFGHFSEAFGRQSLAMGNSSKAHGYGAVTIGSQVNANGTNAVAIGFRSTASGNYAMVLGRECIASGSESVALGYYATSEGSSSFAAGSRCTSSNFGSVAMGVNSIASGNSSVAFGQNCDASMSFSFAAGLRSEARGWASTAIGEGTVAATYASVALGKYNKYKKNEGQPNEEIIDDLLLTVGNGTSDSSRKNALILNRDGDLFIEGTLKTQYQDYAEYFESKTGKAIPVGTPVVLDAGKIRKAKNGETPIGIISVGAGIVGGSHMDWPGKYLKDDYGKRIIEKIKEEILEPKMEKVKKERQKMEKKTIEQVVTTYEIVKKGKKYVEQPIEKIEKREVEEPVFKTVSLFDEKGKTKVGEHQIPVMETYEDEVPVVDEHGKLVMVGSGKFETIERPKLNPNYDPQKEYISREKRPEWNCVGLLGQIPLKKGSPIAPSWLKIKDISKEVELWLVK